VRDGIYVGFAPGSLFRNNSFKRVRYGIHFMYADNNTFEDNIFEWSEAGAALMYSKNIVLRRNIFAHSRSSRAYGLLLQECSAVWAENNVIFDNSRGLFINVSSDGIFKNNIFLGNDLALQIYSAAENNAIVGNDFIGNLQLIELDQAGSNWWDGNYWDDYKGADFDADGIGDSPFRTRDPLGTLILDHPQLRLFRYGPGVEALELAEQSFPVMDIPEIVDLNPAMAPIAGRTAYIPELPTDQPRSRWALAVFGGLSLLLALAIARAGRPRRKGIRR
jgi:nitrous oxidase accessory protein